MRKALIGICILLLSSMLAADHSECATVDNKPSQIESEVEKLSSRDPREVYAAVGEILYAGEEAVPYLLKFARKNYMHDYEQVAMVYIPSENPTYGSGVASEGYRFTPSSLAIYLIEEIVGLEAVLSYAVDLKGTEYSEIIYIPERYKFEYEFTMSAAIEMYENQLKLKEKGYLRSLKSRNLSELPGILPFRDCVKEKFDSKLILNRSLPCGAQLLGPWMISSVGIKIPYW